MLVVIRVCLRLGHIFRNFWITIHAWILRSHLNFLQLKIVFSHFQFPTFSSPFKSQFPRELWFSFPVSHIRKCESGSETYLVRKMWPRGEHFSRENPRLNLISHFSGQNSIVCSQIVMWEVGNGMWAFKILISSFWFLKSHFLHFTSKSFYSIDFTFLGVMWQLHVLLFSNMGNLFESL